MDRFRLLQVPETAAGMRLDRFLARRFADRSRSALARAIRRGEVTDTDGRPLRASTTLHGSELLRLYIPGIAPGEPMPPMPPVLWEDERVAVVDKPAGLLCHPAGTAFVWGLINIARAHWPHHRVELCHRLDRDTSGVLVITKDLDANRSIKRELHEGEGDKEYVAIVKGRPTWSERVLDGPIGPARGPVRIQMAVRPDGLSARTGVTVEALHERAPLARVRCALHTGRTHQIRVHLAHAGHPLLGDRVYGVPPEVFLHTQDVGVDAFVIAAAGAPRQALHAARVCLPHPDGGTIDVTAPLPDDMARWWADPDVLPLDERVGE